MLKKRVLWSGAMILGLAVLCAAWPTSPPEESHQDGRPRTLRGRNLCQVLNRPSLLGVAMTSRRLRAASWVPPGAARPPGGTHDAPRSRDATRSRREVMATPNHDGLFSPDHS